jgi:hypothetical protein
MPIQHYFSERLEEATEDGTEAASASGCGALAFCGLALPPVCCSCRFCLLAAASTCSADELRSLVAVSADLREPRVRAEEDMRPASRAESKLPFQLKRSSSGLPVRCGSLPFDEGKCAVLDEVDWRDSSGRGRT